MHIQPSILEAILALDSDAEVAINGEDYDQITWLNGTSEISKPDIETKLAELTTNYNNQAYGRTRKRAYPAIEEQLDLLYKDMLADKGDKTGEWFKAVKAVKDASPKE